MLAAFSAYIRDISMFLIFTNLILLLTPNGRFQSYIRLALGFMLVLLAIRPLGGLLNAFGGDGLPAALSRLSVGYHQDVMALEIAAQEGGQTELILETYEKELRARLQTIVESSGQMTFISASFTLGESGAQFGMVESIRLTIAQRPPNDAKKPLIRIEPIHIEPIRRSDALPDAEPPAVATLKKTISDFYNISTQHIYCNVQ